MRYLWKDNIQIFHLVPKEVMYVQWFGCKQVLKIMATSRTPSSMSDTSISSSLSLDLPTQILSQAKDMRLALVFVFIIVVFLACHFPRCLINLYEMFNVEEAIRCDDLYLPPLWFLCVTDVAHVLMALNGIANFFIYCWLNADYR